MSSHRESSAMSARIAIDYVTHTFRGQPTATLEDVDATIQAGEKIALIGRSGCGKSTLLHMLAGLMLPSQGCVRIDGRRVTKPSAKWNMMFQKPSLYPWMNVRQNAALGLVFAGQGRSANTRVDALLDLVGLGDNKDANVQQLSGGQQQRVALARSLATEPDLLLLDEPFSALDAFTRSALQDEVAHITRQRDLTLVIVTHDIEEAVAMADRVLIMSRNPGTIVGEVRVDLPFPRDRNRAEFTKLREHLMNKFRDSGDAHAAKPENIGKDDASQAAA